MAYRCFMMHQRVINGGFKLVRDGRMEQKIVRDAREVFLIFTASPINDVAA